MKRKRVLYYSVETFSVISFEGDSICHVVLFRKLKGQCHKAFAVLGQFYTKIITLATTRISNEFYQRGLHIINFLRIFETSKLE